MVLAISSDGSVQRHLTALFEGGALSERKVLAIPTRSLAGFSVGLRLCSRKATQLSVPRGITYNEHALSRH